jgi:hypothetical protein
MRMVRLKSLRDFASRKDAEPQRTAGCGDTSVNGDEDIRPGK